MSRRSAARRVELIRACLEDADADADAPKRRTKKTENECFRRLS